MYSTPLSAAFDGLYSGVLNSSFLPVFFAIFAFAQLVLYSTTLKNVHLFRGLGTMIGTSLWLARDEIFGPALGIEIRQHAASHGLSMWWLAFPVLALAAIITFFALTGHAENAVPTPETPTLESVLSPLVQWLLELGRTLPTKHSAAIGKIRDHITALESLRAELPAGSLSLEPITKMVSSDLRDLVVRYKRVELARKFLPNMATAGEDELTGGLLRIESAIAEQRAAVANAAVNDLKVQERYIETKHAHAEQPA